MKYSHSESPVGTSTQIRRAARPSSTMDVKVSSPLHLPPSNLPSSPGNRNNFASQKACQNYCLSESCPPGTVVAKEAEAGRLVSCSNPGERESVRREEGALSISHTLSPLSLSLRGSWSSVWRVSRGLLLLLFSSSRSERLLRSQH